MKKLLLSGFVMLLGVTIFAQNNVTLKMNLEKNKVYRFSSTSEQTITQTINGNQQTTETKVEHAISLKMLDATADFMVTEVHIDTLTTNTNAMGKAINVSSTIDGDVKSAEMTDVISFFMNRLSKNALYVKIDYTGKVIEIVNAKMLSDVILKDTSAITLTGVTGTAVKKQIAGMISDKTLKTTIEMFTHQLPGKQVTAGDIWDINVTMATGGMSLDINTNYHLDKISGNYASLTVTSEIKTSANADPIISGPAKVTYDDLKGVSKATMVIDTRTGLMTEQKAKSQIAGNLGISAPGMTMTMPMEITGESKIIGL